MNSERKDEGRSPAPTTKPAKGKKTKSDDEE